MCIEDASAEEPARVPTLGCGAFGGFALGSSWSVLTQIDRYWFSQQHGQHELDTVHLLAFASFISTHSC
ncbi:hypothetical protein GWI33_022969 [Rhynchophorus ferrugineus]|uniref:Uncharacterized protein n=1 Tax=Rhynchophorus ferrugineus TaxID=354439 RepID=A0A834I010_RHYFE|nr:hypothetical protein GWI33_022973 [Rhynchophorus ferrugineus]KAF7264601.1 hypothetical protein GWI33_022969 [Rhynchophorus ferrugineus]